MAGFFSSVAWRPSAIGLGVAATCEAVTATVIGLVKPEWYLEAVAVLGQGDQTTGIVLLTLSALGGVFLGGAIGGGYSACKSDDRSDIENPQEKEPLTPQMVTAAAQQRVGDSPAGTPYNKPLEIAASDTPAGYPRFNQRHKDVRRAILGSGSPLQIPPSPGAGVASPEKVHRARISPSFL